MADFDLARHTGTPRRPVDGDKRLSRMALLMSGRFRESIPRLREAVEAGPDAARASFLIGTAHLAMNEPHEALQPLRDAISEDPELVGLRKLWPRHS